MGRSVDILFNLEFVGLGWADLWVFCSLMNWLGKGGHKC